ncbi:NADH-quinone oxidoreductase subunit NuoF [uncultured Desulfosarcina sp.]|uniref:NADH-quinone oxidoreductase subunit NuoF n=1 Tax=uncultured Desulfosarcina sp. TaxID=218289 RepID=UPI0029C93BA9|nr:NADH-quinone oxidoreductase subunit NuoF [uncultured Desulfosarcina sp.]
MLQLTIDDLHRIKEEVLRASVLEAGKTSTRITVHMGTCGISSGADRVYRIFSEELAATGRKDIAITTSGCAGICNREPIISVERVGEETVKYAAVDENRARLIFRRHILEGQVVADWVFARGWEQKDADGGESGSSEAAVGDTIRQLPFFGRQELRVMRNRGLIRAEKIDETIARDGFFGAAKALLHMTPDAIIREVKDSGIRGRGGAGFPTGMKWDFAARSPGDVKYVLCNADEGDPGAFMDRCVLESDPHAVLEGMIIAARAIGAHQGYIYCRAEYPLAVKMLILAIDQARQYGLLGENILGTGFGFDIDVYRGAGAFVCGEETALMTSIEGRRGTPRPRPPFPAVQGLWKKPTILNNVETLASIPQIILKGAAWYAGVGTLRSKGTKVFALTGDVANVGLVEVPMGIPLGDIIFDIGGGVPRGKTFKAVQLGGPSGGCVPAGHLNTPVDYESITRLGAIVGSGGMIVMDNDKCMVDVARFFMEFCMEESCGKCTPCRVGTRKMLEVLTRICRGEGRAGDIATLERWSAIMQQSALCGLGQTAPNPVLSTLRYFRDEYEAHIYEKRCPAAVCASLFKAPCQHACPIGMDIPAYIALVRTGRVDDAYQVLLQTNPFPSVCGRVCDHVCETKCRRSAVDEPLSIKHLKRYITDHASRPPVKRMPVTRRKKVAIVGAGPSGLTAARDLISRGYVVTVFEGLPEPGGMLRWGIPAYRLPREILAREIRDITDMGVELRCNTWVGRDVGWETLKKNVDGIYLAMGAQKSASMGVQGEELAGVRGAVEFLRAHNLGRNPEVGRRVAVVGGGNSAIDAARCVLRLGAQTVMILYRRRRSDMPAQKEEIRAAEAEGITIHDLVAPVRLEGGNGRVGRIVCQRMVLGEFGSDGRRKPVVQAGAEFVLEVDQVIVAIGQQPDFSAAFPAPDVQLTPHGFIEANRDGRAAAAMIFAGGDAVRGPDSVVHAIADGHRAAAAMDRTIREKNGEPPYRPSPGDGIDIPMTVAEEIREAPRVRMPESDVSQRSRTFKEIELGLSPQDAQAEADRCLRCDLTSSG